MKKANAPADDTAGDLLNAAVLLEVLQTERSTERAEENVVARFVRTQRAMLERRMNNLMSHIHQAEKIAFGYRRRSVDRGLSPIMRKRFEALEKKERGYIRRMSRTLSKLASELPILNNAPKNTRNRTTGLTGGNASDDGSED